MATVKEVKNPIKSHQYVSDSIAYILSPENRDGNEKCFQASFLNCFNTGLTGLSQQFCEIRQVFRKDSGILAHHYVSAVRLDNNQKTFRIAWYRPGHTEACRKGEVVEGSSMQSTGRSGFTLQHQRRVYCPHEEEGL